MLSNGRQAKAGSITAEWEHFADWKKINDEGETGVIDLDTLIRAICPKERLLDIIENFTVFQDTAGGTIKLVAKNHQFQTRDGEKQPVLSHRDDIIIITDEAHRSQYDTDFFRQVWDF